ncbi:MAG: hypothetical protein GY705_14235 [Bacteroidetes bacterium]|nr:hypothetical protein [Bacteroidota bacterium]
MSKSNNDNHANQCNPNNDAYWQSRGEDFRSENWEDRIDDDYQPTNFDLNNHSNQLNPNHSEHKK